MPRRLGVLGGTFDPIHHGHLVAAQAALHQFELTEVVFVPTGQPWMKSDRRVTSSEHRYLMTVIATASNPRFCVHLTQTADVNMSKSACCLVLSLGFLATLGCSPVIGPWISFVACFAA